MLRLGRTVRGRECRKGDGEHDTLAVLRVSSAGDDGGGGGRDALRALGEWSDHPACAGVCLDLFRCIEHECGTYARGDRFLRQPDAFGEEEPLRDAASVAD
jgi:hypothetical protein